MNAIERFFKGVEQDFPDAKAVLYMPDDETNETWCFRAFRGDETVTVEWHAGLEMIGVSRRHSTQGFPDEVVSIRTATEQVHQALSQWRQQHSRRRLVS